MRLYSPDEEERIRVQGMVRDWTRSGLLDATQGAQLEAELRVELKRTNPFLRAGLALFTGLIVSASVGLLIMLLVVNGYGSVGVTTGLAALACIGLAEYVIRVFRCYRFGVEEAFAVAAAVLLAISGAALTSWSHIGFQGLPAVVALMVGAAGGCGLYRRFGFVYAAVGASVCAAAIPFQLDRSATIQRALAAAVIASVFVLARSKRLTYRGDYPGDEYGVLQAAAWAGVYLVLNVQLTGEWYKVDGWFYWCTYIVTWVLPVIGLGWGLREKDRELIDVSLVLAFVTLLTNKPYLGWTRHTWDPGVLGVVLLVTAIAVRRWLSNGPGGERHGFTSARLLDKDRAALSLVSMASAVVQPAASIRAEPAASEFGGGRSGGGGGGGTF